MYTSPLDKPINFEYIFELDKLICFLQQYSSLEILENTPRLHIKNSYYHRRLKGTSSQVYTRKAIKLLLERALAFLPDHLGFVIFDVFRSLQTQASLFDEFSQFIRKQNPELDNDAHAIEVRKFVAHPNEPSRFIIPPHNSGGSIDLTLFDIRTGELIDMGTDFDALSEAAETDYYERDSNRSMVIRNNRRMLYHAMTQCGFVNFTSEWWHYSLGDCLWANVLNTDWFYPSLENEVNNKECAYGVNYS